ncbi:peptidoglycan DD-metalloendopeptidase family protein [Nannocystis sp. SCPEA4]|uniref:peptidoglycan DD-metalloendopeptidase family protein n=1 Tax=Nannocystis sp. SCPEA4 TaxID=2996787 RepID=UPI00226F8E1B|nr:peptidoglycan DD-metalloendopeptidase family protein [Nannocystis sp. SCPEA4]
MRLRPPLLLVLLAPACYSPDHGGDTAAWPTLGAGPAGDSSSGTTAPGSTSDAPEPTIASTSGWTTDASSTSDPDSTGPDPTDPTTITDSGTTTTGVLPDPSCPRVRVLVPPGEILNVRPQPSTAMAPVGSLASGAIVDVLAIVQGEAIDAVDTWYQVAGNWPEGYVFGAWVECTLDEPSAAGYFLPLECGTTATVTQGNFGPFSHQGTAAYAFDFGLALGTPLVAIEEGTVSHAYGGTMPGDPCYDGGGMECINSANYVTLQHPDGTTSNYAHLSQVSVAVGQYVPRGAVVGLTGSTGWSTGPHAHVARQEGCGQAFCQSIAVQFVDVAPDGIPEGGESVTSQNCP